MLKNYVQFIDNKNREVVDYMLSKMSKFIDIIIPRGGKNLVKKFKIFKNTSNRTFRGNYVILILIEMQILIWQKKFL